MREAVRLGVGLLASVVLAGCSGAGQAVSRIVPEGGPRTAESASHIRTAGRISGPLPMGCGIAAVFVRFDTEIRGYPLAASGVTPACAKIAGPDTQLVERGALAISVHGNLHSLSFQSDRGLTIHRRDANGDARPNRSVGVAQDYVALAVDSLVNDFVVASEGYEADNCWFVVADEQTRASAQFCDSNLVAIHALTVNNRDELIAIGPAVTDRRTRIDVFAAPATTPRLVRTISGAATGLPVLGDTDGYLDVSYSLVTDPRTGELYVYSHLYDFLASRAIPGAPPASIAEFSALAAGNAAPIRVLSGTNVPLVQAAFSVNVLGADDRGNLYVILAGTSLLISVFGPGANGNALADRVISDPTASVGFVGASIGVRTHAR